MKNINNEYEFESYIKNHILIPLSLQYQNYKILNNKKAVDIIIARNGINPKLFFIEIKYFKNNKGRLGLGQKKGNGFQPEILAFKIDYFENNLMWILGSEHSDDFWFVSNEVVRGYLNGGEIGFKHNGIQKKFFKEVPSITKLELDIQIKKWLKIEI